MSNTADRYTQPMLLPLPIVVDADVLIRNVDYVLRCEREGALIASASGEYSLLSGVVLFATPTVIEEVERHLPDIATRRATGFREVVVAWNELFLPKIRVVELGENVVKDSRVEGVRVRHADDAPTAALAVALAPCLLLTDNRQHFSPLNLSDRRTDEIAIDANAVSQFVVGTRGVMLFPTLTGAAVIEGSKKIVQLIGKQGALIVALVALGAVVLYWESEPGSRLRENAGRFAKEVGPPLMRAVEQGLESVQRVSALAIEPADQPSPALLFVARILAKEQAMSTRDIALRLRQEGYRFAEPGAYSSQVRAWLLRNDCFFEVRRGHWALGYYSVELRVPNLDEISFG